MRVGWLVLLSLLAVQVAGKKKFDWGKNWGNKPKDSDDKNSKMKCFRDCMALRKGRTFCEKECKKKDPGSGDQGKKRPRPPMSEEIDKSAAAEAARAIKECREDGNVTLEVCLGDDAVQEAIANVTGKNVTEEDVRRFAKIAAKHLLPRLMKECKKNAGNKQEEKACLKAVSEEMKLLLGSTSDKRREAKLLLEGLEDEVLEILQSCDKEYASCRNDAKKRLAEALKIPLSKIERKFLESIRKAMSRQYAKGVLACRQDSDLNEQELKDCLDDVKSSLRHPDASDKDPDERDAQKALEKASKRLITEAMKECKGQPKSCRAEKVRKQMEEIRGTKVTSSEVGEMEQESSLEAALEELEACIQAKKEAEETIAGCGAEAVATFKELRGDTGRGSKNDKELKKEIGKRLMSARFESCLDYETKEEKNNCRKALGEESKEVLLELFGKAHSDGRRDDQKQERRVKWMERTATRLVLGTQYMTCMRAAREANETDIEDAKAECKASVKTMYEDIQDMSAAEKVEHLIARFAGTKVATALEECPDELKICLAEAKEMVKDMPKGKRMFRRSAKLGVKKRLAEAYAACLDAGTAESVCVAEAKVVFKAITKGSDEAYDKLLPKIKELAILIQDGQPTKLNEKPIVEVEFNGAEGASCDNANAQQFKAGILGALNSQSMESLRPGRLWSGDDIEMLPCEVMMLRPLYKFKISLVDHSEELQGKADEYAAAIFAVLDEDAAGGRRLTAKYDEVYASQSTEEEVWQTGENDPILADSVVRTMCSLVVVVLAVLSTQI